MSWIWLRLIGYLWMSMYSNSWFGGKMVCGNGGFGIFGSNVLRNCFANWNKIKN